MPRLCLKPKDDRTNPKPASMLLGILVFRATMSSRVLSRHLSVSTWQVEALTSNPCDSGFRVYRTLFAVFSESTWGCFGELGELLTGW